MRRTDPHRPGAIVPAEYRYVLSYEMPHTMEGMPSPGYRLNCERDRAVYEREVIAVQSGRPVFHLKLVKVGEHDADGRCCILGLRRIAKVSFASTGGDGKCSVCGARYVYGDVWRHEPTGDHIHVGHNCADKYQMLTDRSEWELMRDRRAAATAAAIKAEQTKAHNAEMRRLGQAFLEQRPELAAALSKEHPILKDMAEKLYRFGSLSEKQIAFAIKLGSERQEVVVPAPVGRGKVRGKVIKVKAYDGFHGGTTWKMTVKVETESGVWLVWTTIPATIMDEVWKSEENHPEWLKGRTVEFTATLAHGNDAHFALGSRPTAGRVLEEVQ